MKTGEEKFDDEIRQKLRHSEVKPPAGLFDMLIPPPDKKRWFLWIWVVGILILGSTALMMYNHPSFETTHTIPNSSIETTGKSSSDYKISSANASTKSVTNEDLKPNHSGNNSNEINNSDFTSNKSNGKDFNKKGPDKSGRIAVASLKENKLKPSNKNSEPNSNLKNKSAGTNNLYYGKSELTSNLIYNYDHLYYPAISLPYTEKDFIKQLTKIIKKDSLALITHIPTKYSLEIYAAKVYYYSKITAQTNDTAANRLLNSKPEKSPVSSGLDIGLKVRYSLKKHFSVSAGLNYSNRKEDFGFTFTEYYQSISVDTINYFILFPFSPPILVTNYDSTIVNKSRNIPIKHDITYNVFSFSGEIRYEIPVGRFVIEPQVGFIIDIFSQMKGATNFNPDFKKVSATDYYKQRMQTRIKGGLQFSYALGEKIDLLVNSEYQYALNKMETSQPFYSEKINRVSFGAGVRYNIFKRQATKSN